MGPRTVDRRTFLRWGALASVAPALPGPLAALTACSDAGRSARRDEAPADSAAASRTASPHPFEFEDASIADLQRRMDAGELTGRDLVRAYLERIDEVDRHGPMLRSILETNPDAERIAQSLDEERRAGRVRGPLHGIPVLLKDNVDTGDRMTTTAGSLALAGSVAARDAHVAAKLREAGAVLLGKTNMSEWANIRSSQSSSAWSSRGGQGRNPYALDRSPCGSSSGSGSAIAANLAVVAVGTETDGSIVCPASSQSLVGIKPTVGLVSRTGIIPIAHSQDTAGPMARTVGDAAVLLGALAGEDSRDPATAGSRERARADYASVLDPTGLRGARLGVAREGYFGYSGETDRVIEEAIAELERLGAIIVDPADITTAGELASSPAELDVLLYELKADLNAYLRGRGAAAPVQTLADVIDFNERNSASVMPWFGQDLFIRAEEKGPLTDPAYRKARSESLRLAREEGIDATLRKHRLDALVAPTMAPPFKIDLVNGDHFLGGSSQPAAVAGYPAVTVPAGYASGLPVGLTFMGRAWSEAALIRFAYAFEQGTRARKPPSFAPTLDPDGAPAAATS